MPGWPGDGDREPVRDRDRERGRRPLSEAAFADALAGLDAVDLARFVAALHRARGAEAVVETSGGVDGADGPSGATDAADASEASGATGAAGAAGAVATPGSGDASDDGDRGRASVRVRVRPTDGASRTLLVRPSPSRPRRRLRRLRASFGAGGRPSGRGADGSWSDVDALVSLDGTAPVPPEVDVVDAADLHREATYGVDRATFDALVREHLGRPGLVARTTGAGARGARPGADGRGGVRRSRSVAVVALALVALLVAALVGAGAVPAGLDVRVGGGIGDGADGGNGGGDAPGEASAIRTPMNWSVGENTGTMTPTAIPAGTATPDAVPPTRPATPVPVVAGCPTPPRAAHPATLRPAVAEPASAHGLQGWRLVGAENVSRYDGLNSQETPYEPIVRHVAGYVDPGSRSYRVYLDQWASPGQAEEVAREMVGFRHAWLAWGRYTVSVDVYGTEGERLSDPAATEPSRRVLAAVGAPSEDPGTVTRGTATATGTLGRTCVERLLARTNATAE